jgi:lysyl-tRNA synthetase class 2
MLEWYRARQPYQTLFEDVAAFLRLATQMTGAQHLRWRGRTCDVSLPLEHLTVAEAFARYAKIDLLSTLDEHGAGDRDLLAAHCQNVKADDRWSDLFSRLLVERVEPHLGVARACVLYEYPMAEAALARACAHDRRVAERFELYACGVELAKGFGELTDATEQRARFIADMDLKQRLYGERYPLDEDFLAALCEMPQACGCALGFDRLVMLATGAARISDVRWTPWVGDHA